MGTGMVVLAFFIGLVVMLMLITLHELGHFIVAKMSGAYVYEFSIGFGPAIYTHKGKETWFSIRAFPLGGYCSIASDLAEPPKGREDEEVPDDRKMDYIARWKKAFFILAGPIMNIIVALTITTITLASTQVYKNDMTYYGATYNKDMIAYKLMSDAIHKETDQGYIFDLKDKELTQNYAIWGWQVRYSDSIDKENVEYAFNNIDGKDSKINDLKNNEAVDFNKTVYTFINHLKAGDNKRPVQIRFAFKELEKYNNNSIGEVMYTDWSEKYDSVEKEKARGDEHFKDSFIIGDNVGIAAPNRIFRNSTEAYGYGFTQTFKDSVSILKSFGMLFTGHFNQLSGPVGVAKQTASMLNSADTFFLFVANLSANLFILNMIFIPPLDGYKFIENLIEMIFKKELNKKYKIIVNVVGAVLFLALFIGITIKDFVL